MRKKFKKGQISVCLFLCFFTFYSCSKDIEESPVAQDNSILKALTNPQWKVDARCFLDGSAGAFDDIAVKDPSIISSGGYHLFYTGRNSSAWSIGYASASSISGLASATHRKLTSIGSGSGLAAPQIFYFPVKGKWFLIYQNGTAASFSTNTNVSNYSGWTAVRSMGFSDGGIDYWCISDGTNVYCFYSANNGTHTIKRRSTTVANFPYNWSSATTVATDCFEGVHVYKNKANGKYYMVVEDMGASRWQELWTATSLGGTWTKVSEQWAHKTDLTYNADIWTHQVSHLEILRSGTNERMEIDNIDRCQMLIQGVVDGNYPNYASVPYDIGLIRNY